MTRRMHTALRADHLLRRTVGVIDKNLASRPTCHRAQLRPRCIFGVRSDKKRFVVSIFTDIPKPEVISPTSFLRVGADMTDGSTSVRRFPEERNGGC